MLQWVFGQSLYNLYWDAPNKKLRIVGDTANGPTNALLTMGQSGPGYWQFSLPVGSTSYFTAATALPSSIHISSSQNQDNDILIIDPSDSATVEELEFDGAATIGNKVECPIGIATMFPEKTVAKFTFRNCTGDIVFNRCSFADTTFDFHTQGFVDLRYLSTMGDVTVVSDTQKLFGQMTCRMMDISATNPIQMWFDTQWTLHGFHLRTPAEGKALTEAGYWQFNMAVASTDATLGYVWLNATLDGFNSVLIFAARQVIMNASPSVTSTWIDQMTINCCATQNWEDQWFMNAPINVDSLSFSTGKTTMRALVTIRNPETTKFAGSTSFWQIYPAVGDITRLTRYTMDKQSVELWMANGTYTGTLTTAIDDGQANLHFGVRGEGENPIVPSSFFPCNCDIGPLCNLRFQHVLL